MFSLTFHASLTFKVMSSEQEASSIPDGSHLMALTSFCKTQCSLTWLSRERYCVRWGQTEREGKKRVEKLLTVWPWKVFRGRSLPRRHTWMHMSVLQEANVVLFCQSTSSAGAVEYFNAHVHNHYGERLWAHNTNTTKQETFSRVFIIYNELTLPEWKGNCCLASPVCASQMIVVWKMKLHFNTRVQHFSRNQYTECHIIMLQSLADLICAFLTFNFMPHYKMPRRTCGNFSLFVNHTHPNPHR